MRTIAFETEPIPWISSLPSSSSLKFVEIEGVKNHDCELVVAWKKNNLNPSISLFLEILEDKIMTSIG
ncbi:hypothetical protein V7139_11025 [Neobacillus drentensis]|uniref:hypothetical protein n=1 Tax=Neobacillus drentensis TaxID=220684 RepID=UPI0030014F1B